MGSQIRQGDVLLIPTGHLSEVEFQAVEPEDGKLILARGEATGHHHSVPASAAVLCQGTRGNSSILFLDVAQDTELSHQEHGILTVPAGLYFVVRQTEYDPLGDRSVLD